MTSSRRPYQEHVLGWFAELPVKRAILAWSTSAGKTRSGYELAQALGARKLLIVGTASSRPTWVRQAKQWAPQYDPRAVRFGAANKSLTKKQAAERDEAYAADVQAVSYSLLKHIDATPRDLVIFDEAHKLKNPNSQQSRQAKEFLRAYPDMPALILTATPIPNEVQDVWNLVDMLYPAYLGEATDTGEASWAFRRAYCQSEEGYEGRKRYFGARQENLPRLAAKLAPFTHRVSSEDVALHTPALNTAIRWVDEPKFKDVDIAGEWLEEREADGSARIGLFAWTHATAHALATAAYEAGWEVVMVTGKMSPEQRQAALDGAQAKARVCVVGTAGSLAESISLSFLKQALIFEWRSTPGQAVQFAGRFARQDSVSSAPTYLLYVARTDDAIDAERLTERLEAVNTLYKADAKSVQLQELMAPRVLDEELTQRVMDVAFGTARLGLASALETEDDDD